MDYSKYTLGELLSFGDETVKRNATSILKCLQKMKAEMKQESFNITSVCREDLQGIGYDTSKVDDSTMSHLASKMADAYCDNGFWIDLPILADALDIPKKDEFDCYWDCGRYGKDECVRDILTHDKLGAHNTTECRVCSRKATSTLIKEAQARNDKRFADIAVCSEGHVFFKDDGIDPCDIPF